LKKVNLCLEEFEKKNFLAFEFLKSAFSTSVFTGGLTKVKH